MEEKKYLTQDLNFERKIYITDLLRKYFDPIEFQKDTVDNPRRGFEDYEKQLAEQRETFRDVSYELQLLKIQEEDGETPFHPDYDYIGHSSRVVFRKPFSELSPKETDRLDEFISNLFDLFMLYIADYWLLYYKPMEERNRDQLFTEDRYGGNEVRDILNILKIYERSTKSEILLRDISLANLETEIKDPYKQKVLDYYVQLKYQNFMHRFRLPQYLTPEEKKKTWIFRSLIIQ